MPLSNIDTVDNYCLKGLLYEKQWKMNVVLACTVVVHMRMKNKMTLVTTPTAIPII